MRLFLLVATVWLLSGFIVYQSVFGFSIQAPHIGVVPRMASKSGFIDCLAAKVVKAQAKPKTSR